MKPTMREPYGMSIISAAVPTATPPASVAFWMCTWVGRARAQSSPGACTPHALAPGGKGDSQCVSASQEPAEGPGPSSCVLCTSSLGTVRGHKSCVPAGETYWHVCVSPVNLCAQVCMSDGLPVTYADIRPVCAQTPEPEPVGLRRLQAYLYRVLRCRLRG